jgi:CoA:oxalate CoA-transferase
MATAPGALAGVRVLDLTRYLAGPFCTMLLADMGADVVKLEPPSGEREFGAGGDVGAYFFLAVNRNKRSATLDLRDARGREVFLRLIDGADVVVENFRPAVMPDLGLAAPVLRNRNPRLVYCNISGFGASGPYADRPGFDQIAQGMSGLMSVTGTEQPTRTGIAIGDLLAGIFAAYGITLALHHRHTSGEGQIVTTSLLEALVGVLSWSAGMYFATGTAPPYGVFRAADRRFNIACGNERQWRALCEAVGATALAADPRFATAPARVGNRAALTAALEARLQERTAAEWIAALNARDIPSGPINDMAEVFADAQVRAREMYVELAHPVLGTLKTTGVPVKLSASPGAVRAVPPELGADTDAVLAAAGFSAAEIAALRDARVV